MKSKNKNNNISFFGDFNSYAQRARNLNEQVDKLRDLLQ